MWCKQHQIPRSLVRTSVNSGARWNQNLYPVALDSRRSSPWHFGHLPQWWCSSRSTGSISTVFLCPSWAPGGLSAAPSVRALLRFFREVGSCERRIQGLSYARSCRFRLTTSRSSVSLVETTIWSLNFRSQQIQQEVCSRTPLGVAFALGSLVRLVVSEDSSRLVLNVTIFPSNRRVKMDHSISPCPPPLLQDLAAAKRILKTSIRVQRW